MSGGFVDEVEGHVGEETVGNIVGFALGEETLDGIDWREIPGVQVVWR